jgi:phosphoenolpyruvate synthase/pyruvate phosphate dikinase
MISTAFCRDEASLVKLIDTYWNDDVQECQVQRTERDYLFHELVQVRRELLEADEHLAKLVFQAARQANTQVQSNSRTIDIIQLGI